MWNTEAWSSLSGTLEDKKADDEIAYSELGKSPFPKASRQSEAFECCVVPIGILGRESRDLRGQRGMERPLDEGVVSASTLHLDTGIPARTWPLARRKQT